MAYFSFSLAQPCFLVFPVVVTLACVGFDRHLLGLYLIAKEEGRPTPELFLDPLYAKRCCVEGTG